MASFCNNLAYSMEWTCYAVYFREQHNWKSATWAGVLDSPTPFLKRLIFYVHISICKCKMDICAFVYVYHFVLTFLQFYDGIFLLFQICIYIYVNHSWYWYQPSSISWSFSRILSYTPAVARSRPDCWWSVGCHCDEYLQGRWASRLGWLRRNQAENGDGAEVTEMVFSLGRVPDAIPVGNM